MAWLVHTDLVTRPAREPAFRYVLWFAAGICLGWTLGVFPMVGEAPTSVRMLACGVLAVVFGRAVRPRPQRRLCPNCEAGSHLLHRRHYGTCSIRYCRCGKTPPLEIDVGQER